VWWKSFPQHSPLSSSVSVCLITVGFVLLSASHYVTVNERFIILISHVSPNSLFPMGTINNSVTDGKYSLSLLYQSCFIMWLLEKWFFLIWRQGSEAVSSLRFLLHFKTSTAKLTIEITPGSSHTLWIWWKTTQWSDMSNYSSFENVQGLLNVWYLWKVINMMMMIIIFIIYSRQIWSHWCSSS